MNQNSLLIVLYNENIYSSKSIQSFLGVKPHNTKLVVWDNSPTALQIEQIEVLKSELCEVEYYHSPENLSLSVIYNRFVEANCDCDLLYIFDQDSTFDKAYFDNCEKSFVQNRDIGLFVPYVMSGGRMVSPGYFYYYKGKFYDQIITGRVQTLNMLVIASGMVIAVGRIGDLRFDENLKFYGIDSKFALDYAKRFNYFFVLDYQLKHELSISQQELPAIKYKRFLLYRSSALYIQKSRHDIFLYLIAQLCWILKSVIAYIKYCIIKCKK